jgi:gamma-glutamyltranspeptidase/glutathione hydrolase
VPFESPQYADSSFTEIVDLIKSGGGVMSLEDLATCDAEVITPIKYDFKVGTAGDDGVTLWEVSH